MNEDASWIEIERHNDLVAAQLMRSYLAAHGLDVLLPEESTAAVFANSAMIVHGVRVMVPADQARQARRLLAEAAAR